MGEVLSIYEDFGEVFGGGKESPEELISGFLLTIVKILLVFTIKNETKKDIVRSTTAPSNFSIIYFATINPSSQIVVLMSL